MPSTPISDRPQGILTQGRWLLVVVPALCLALTVGTFPLRHRAYTATALTQAITPGDAYSLLRLREQNGGLTPAQKNFRQLGELLADPVFLKAALANVKLQEPINPDPGAADPRFALLKKKLQASLYGDNLFGIELIWDNPAEAEEIVGAIQKEFIQEIGEEHAAQSTATLAFLDSQIQRYGARLDAAEKLLAEGARLRPGDATSAPRARQIRSLTRDYPVMQAMDRRLRTQREQVTLARDLDRVTATASLRPIGYIHAEPTASHSSVAREALGSVVVGVLLGGLLMPVARRRQTRRAMA